MMNPIFPDGQPWDNLLFAITAVVIVILNRRTMFEKGTGITEVLFPGREAEITSEADETTKNSLSATAG
jgi:hypothetical protein